MSETCELTGTIYDASKQPHEGLLLYATPLTINDELIYSGAKRARSESDGSIEFDLIQGGRYNLRGNALGFEGEGINVTIPESASALLKSLLAVSQIPEEGLTVKANGSAFANLFGTLDFSSRFILTESPASEINIELAASGVTPGDYTSANITVDSYGRVTAAANGAGGGGVWGSIGGDIADQADLIALVGTQLTQAEADALYSATGHNHSGVYQPADTQLDSLAALAYAGNALKVVRVNSGATGFELATISGGSSNTPDWYDAVDDGGLVGDGVTDNTAALQALLDAINTADKDATIFFRPGVYIIAGALQDTSASNSQIVLPKRVAGDGWITVRFLGSTPVPTSGNTISTIAAPVGGSIIKSTLGSGNGQMIGVKGAGALSSTLIGVVFENITLRMPANPTNSALDLSYIPSVSLRNVLVDTGASTVEDVTEPTTTTSYGIKMPLNNIPNIGYVDNVIVNGFYTGIRWGELSSADNLNVWGCHYGIEVPQATHVTAIGRVLMVHNLIPLRFTGGTSYINIRELDIERTNDNTKWYFSTTDVEDASNFGKGFIRWHAVRSAVGIESVFVVNGGSNLDTREIGTGGKQAFAGITNTFLASQNVTLSQDGGTGITISNTNNGSGAESFFTLAAESGTISVEAFSSTFSTASLRNVGGFFASSGLTGGMLFATLGNAPIAFAQNGLTPDVTLNSSGLTIGVGIAPGSASAPGIALAGATPSGQVGLTGYTSVSGVDGLLAVSSNLGAGFGVQNRNASGFSGIEFLNNSGVGKVFCGFNNSNGTEFRFNNFAASGFIDFLIGGGSALKINNDKSITLAVSLQTADPTSGVGPLWKLGAKKTGTLVLDTGNYLEVSVAGVTYKVALVS